MSRRRSQQSREPRTYGQSRNITPRMFVNGAYVAILNDLAGWDTYGADDSDEQQWDLYLHPERPARTQAQQDASQRNGRIASAKAKANGGMYIASKKDPHAHLKS